MVEIIKLIATDLDGTLLDSKKNLPRDFTSMLDLLSEKGVIFAVASGRQYYTVMKQFRPLNRNLMYIVENGALVVCDDEVKACECLDSDVCIDIIKRVRNIPTASLILCCVDGAYGEDNSSPEFIWNTEMFYKKYKLVSDLTQLCPDKQILKLAIFDTDDPFRNVKDVLPCYGGRADVVISGAHWADVMKPGVSKGSAIRQICKIYGIDRSECMCFGDYMNDYEMICECGESYAMQNAVDEIKRAAAHIAPSNDDDGVMRVLKQYFPYA